MKNSHASLIVVKMMIARVGRGVDKRQRIHANQKNDSHAQRTLHVAKLTGQSTTRSRPCSALQNPPSCKKQKIHKKKMITKVFLCLCTFFFFCWPSPIFFFFYNSSSELTAASSNNSDSMKDSHSTTNSSGYRGLLLLHSLT